MNEKTRLRVHSTIIFLLMAFSLIGFFVFFGILSGGSITILFRKANEIDFDLLLLRRAVSLLFWMVFSALTIYVGTTEIFPRLRNKKFKKRKNKVLVMGIHHGILINYVIAIAYSLYQISIVFVENRIELRIIRLLYLADLGIALFGLIIYIMLLHWVPKITEIKH